MKNVKEKSAGKCYSPNITGHKLFSPIFGEIPLWINQSGFIITNCTYSRAVGRKFQPVRPIKPHPYTHPLIIMICLLFYAVRKVSSSVVVQPLPLPKPSALKRAVNLLRFPKRSSWKVEFSGLVRLIRNFGAFFLLETARVYHDSVSCS